jgi:SAM-dependent methyltransferase
MTREWYNEVATRPDGYAQTWTCWVEGPDAQKIFDEKLLAASHGRDVLDCGCGDAAFTVRLAKVTRRIVGVDYAEAMIANARRTAAQASISNMTFVCCHVREDNPLPPQSFDLAYSRRGPMILAHVPALVRPGGILMGIHPLDQSAAEFATRVAQAGLKVASCEGYRDTFHFPSLSTSPHSLVGSPVCRTFVEQNTGSC